MDSDSCIIGRFEEFASLTDNDKTLLSSLEKDVKAYEAGQILRAVGQTEAPFYTLKKGWACSIRLMPDGQRQVLDIYCGGQVMGLNEVGAAQARTELIALTYVEACPFPRNALLDMFANSPFLAHLFFLVLSRDHAVLMERIINVGKRRGVERLAHFLIELRYRSDAACDELCLPFNQSVIADALGMSSVHGSRSLSQLKKMGLIEANGRILEIKDLERMERFCGFEPDYLMTAPATSRNTLTDRRNHPLSTRLEDVAQ